LHTPGICSRRYLTVLFFFACCIASHAQAVRPDLYNALQWRLIGPFRGGRVVAVTGIPGNPTKFYFGAVNGGIWETTDAGVVWRPIFDDQHIASIGAIAVAPSDPNTIYAGTGESDIRMDLSSGDGVYKSTDAGKTWANIGLRETRQISCIVVDTQNANIAYVAALGHAYGPNPDRGVYKTEDGGAHWTKVLDAGPDIGAASLAIATDNPKILFATMWNAHRPPWSTYAPLGGPGSGLYRSADAGKTWTHLTGSGLPDGDWGRSGVAVSRDGQRVYALIDAKTAGLYRSDDGGNTWTLENSDPRLTGRAWYFSDITIDPNHPDVLYIPNVALYRTDDAGKTITIVRGAPGGDDYHELWVDPTDSSRMILGTDQGTTISVNHGETWSTWYNQPTAQIYHVITDNRFPYAVYGPQQDSGGIAVMSRTDYGVISVRNTFSPGGSESGYIAPDPNDPNILYSTGAFGSVSRFDLRTSLSQNVTPWPVPTWGSEINGRRYRDGWNPVLLFSPYDKKTLYFGTQFVMKTADGGLHWETISPDLTGASPQNHDKPDAPPTVDNTIERGFGLINTIAPSSLNGDLIWAGSDTGLIHLTRDSGKTWKDVTPKGLAIWSRISWIEASHFDPAEAYAAIDRHRMDDQQPYLYRTRDYGATWQLIANGISASSFARVVREDPKTRNLLFAGTELGIYVSFDDGDHWQSLQLNLPITSVQDLVIHGEDLIIATHGRSFWILDDITPLRQANDAAKNSSPTFYAPADSVRVDHDAFLETPLPPEEPTAKNPPNGAILDYYLPAAAKRVELQILDSDGSIVRHFSSNEARPIRRVPLPIADRWFPEPQVLETTPGMHRFVWDLASGGSGSDADEDDMSGEFGAPHGPRVVPGTYQTKLIVDGKASARTIKIVMDPRSVATANDLTRQYDVGRKIYAETLRSRQALAEMNSVQKQLSEAEQKVENNPDLKTNLAKMQDSIKKTLFAPGSSWGDAMGLQTANAGLTAALSVVESGTRPAPTQALTAFEEADRALKLRLAEWNEIKTNRLPQLNEQLKQAHAAPIAISEVEQEVEYLMTR
jgi:photosystem II stability/assembly factor-like uncharacterized protein